MDCLRQDPLSNPADDQSVRHDLVSESALAVAQYLSEARETAAYRQLIQLNDDLSGETPERRAATAIVAPPLVGDCRFDAFIAAVTEFWLTDAGLSVPDWVHEPERIADPVWYPAGVPGLRESTDAITLECFRRHGLIVDPIDLVSV